MHGIAGDWRPCDEVSIPYSGNWRLIYDYTTLDVIQFILFFRIQLIKHGWEWWYPKGVWTKRSHNSLGRIDGRECLDGERCSCGTLTLFIKAQSYVMVHIFLSIFGLWDIFHCIHNVVSNKEYFLFHFKWFLFDWDMTIFEWCFSWCWDEHIIPFFKVHVL